MERTAISRWQFLLGQFLSQHHCAEGQGALAPGSVAAASDQAY